VDVKRGGSESDVVYHYKRQSLAGRGGGGGRELSSRTDIYFPLIEGGDRKNERMERTRKTGGKGKNRGETRNKITKDGRSEGKKKG